MKKFLLVLILMFIAFAAGIWYAGTSHNPLKTASNPVSSIVEARQITETLTKQSAAWSAGDIKAFMQDYWKSDDLRFASGGTVKRGWQTTYDRYMARYPDRAAMGTLAFTDLDVDVLSPTNALVFGRWTLTRDGDAPTGLFTLHMKKQDGAWKIVSDHTSSAAP